MATAGYGMKFSKGYLGGAKEPGEGGAAKAIPHETDPTAAGGDDIREHLERRHAETGHAHSHIEHHADGHHTSHHIDENGEHSGPHDHENLEALKSHMDQFLNEEGEEEE